MGRSGRSASEAAGITGAVEGAVEPWAVGGGGAVGALEGVGGLGGFAGVRRPEGLEEFGGAEGALEGLGGLEWVEVVGGIEDEGRESMRMATPVLSVRGCATVPARHRDTDHEARLATLAADANPAARIRRREATTRSPRPAAQGAILKST